MVSEGRNTNDHARRSKSKRALTSGLYRVATRIGNAGHIAVDALDVAKIADAVFVEDTRATSKLLALLGFNRPLHSCRGHNARQAERVLRHFRDGRALALVSDAGAGQSLLPAMTTPRCFDRELIWCAVKGAARPVAPSRRSPRRGVCVRNKQSEGP